MSVPNPENIAYFPFPREVARNVVTEVKSIAAGLGTDGLAEHADKIEAGLNRMGRGMDSAGRSIRTGLVVVGIGIGIGLAVIGTGMILQALTNQPRRRRRRKRPGEGGPENVLGDDISYSQDED